MTKLIHNVTQKRTDKLINELADSSGSGRWQGVSFPAQLHEQLLELDQAVRSIGITCCDDAERLDSTWKSTINRMIAPLETDLRYMPEFGFKVMKFKGEREDEGRGYTAKELRRVLEKPAMDLLTNYVDMQPRGKGGRGGKGGQRFYRGDPKGGHDGYSMGLTVAEGGKIESMCFEYRETGKCTSAKCGAMHTGRSGDACKDEQFLKTGECSNWRSCTHVHVWDEKKYGPIKDAIQKVDKSEARGARAMKVFMRTRPVCALTGADPEQPQGYAPNEPWEDSDEEADFDCTATNEEPRTKP